VSDVEEFADRLERVADRLRSLGESRLVRTGADSAPSPADQARSMSVSWASLLYGPGAEPVEVSAFGAGDQLVVIGRDLAARWRDGRLTPAQQAEAANALDALRRSI
jgi:hypothetical protein